MTASYIPPYSSAGDLDTFTNYLNTRKPDPLTLKELREIGITESNSYTLKGTLIGLGIYDDEGKLLQREDLIGLSSKDEGIRRDTYRKILKRTYSELIKRVPIEESTVARVQNYFEVNGAAKTPALKGARLFIWLARQAGYKTADTNFVPSSIEQDKTQKTKEVKDKKKTTNRSNGQVSQLEFDSFVPKKGRVLSDYDEIYLNLLLEKIRTSPDLPSEAIMQEVSRYIDKIEAKSKSRHTKSPEPSLPREEHGNA